MKPQYEPKTPAQKLGYLVEECGEVLAAAGKTLRWGPDSANPEVPPSQQETNREWLLRELADLNGAIRRVEALLRDDYWTAENQASR
jgi:NTP pyrophosphatase (non-canonical NTP hydrolase)